MSRFRGNGFSAESIKVIRAYEEHGWTFERSKSGHAIGKAPDGVETVSIARELSPADRSQQNAEAGLKRWLRTQEREVPSLVELSKPLMAEVTDTFHPSRVAVIAAGVTLGWSPERMVNGAIRLTRSGQTPVVVRKSDRSLTRREWLDLNQRLQRGGDRMVVGMAARMTQEEWVEYVVDHALDTDLRTKVAVVIPGGQTLAEPEPATRPVDGDVVASDPVGAVLEYRPWKATRSGGKYDSKAVLEQVLDGEVVAYLCAECRGFESLDDPHSVAAHYRRAHRLGKGTDTKNPVTERNADYHPTQRLIDALTEYLNEHEDEDVVLAALTWMSTRPDLPVPEPREPLTDAQILAKVRALVGAGPSVEEYDGVVAELREAEEALEAARQREIDLNIAFMEVSADRDRLQSDLDAWLALAPRPQNPE